MNEGAHAAAGIGFRSVALAFITAIAVAAIIWFAVWQMLSPIDGMATAADRLLFALRCAAVALLFTLVAGVEAVSHERLFSTAFNPLLGRETERLKINQRFIQNTVEQFLIFLLGLCCLSYYCDTSTSLRAIVAVSIVWTLGRLAFWVGYHIAPEHRVAGLVGVAQSLIVLLYVTARFGYDVGGPLGAAAPLAAFAGLEIAIVKLVSRR